MTEEHKKKIGLANKGKIITEEHKRKISKTLTGKPQPWNEGKNHFNWKGNKNLGYQSKHNRIRLKYGEPNYCEICGKTDKKKYEWSNKDHKYSLKKEDWQRLCSSCHKKYDIEYNNTRVNQYDK